MNSRERVLAALARGQPDKVPIFEAWIDEPVRRDLARPLGLGGLPAAGGPLLLQGQESVESLDLYCWLVRELGLDATCYDF